jgi:dihydroflavonol-4-reductase
MKILVTGATGFIGSHLVERLSREGHETICLSKEPMYARILESLGCRVVLGDLTNGVHLERLLEDANIVYHLAGVTRARRSRDYYEGNVLGTRNLVDGCLRYGSTLSRLVFVSSLTASGPSPDGRPLLEDVPFHPVSEYGRSKMLAELEVMRLGDHLPWTIVRPAAVYGPREKDMYDYIRIIRRGIEPLIGLKDKLLSLIYVDDLVDGIVRAGESAQAAGRVYFLGSEEPYSYHEIGVAIAHVLNCHPFCLRLPHCLVYALGACATAVGALTGKQVFFNVQKARESVQRAWVCSVERARRELGFHQRVGLEEGMYRTCQWYTRFGWL